ncbi:MAG: CHRD domain-containing protein [Zoogloeaceae bacterium]|nr:CHRD domain-containing protein [Rhodocyclaceae bacterium]MCP5238189.1 CHRD domain-containing protein [Zoogloeaceae bacterium]
MTKKLLALALGLALAGSVAAGSAMKFDTHLEGFTLAGQVVDTKATGEAKVEVIDGGTALRFRVNVAGIDNLLMAHIHVAPIGSPTPVAVTDPAGPVAFWIVADAPPGSTLGETVNGRLAEGFIITNSELSNWNDPNDAMSGTIEGLVNAIVDGRASVIVHTSDGDPGTTMPVAGDSPAGELRGTLQ